jgi:heat shock protein HslJ
LIAAVTTNFKFQKAVIGHAKCNRWVWVGCRQQITKTQ